MKLYISMIRDYLERKNFDASALEGTNSCFLSFRINQPKDPEKSMLYLTPAHDEICFSCGEGSFSLYGETLENAIALTLEACQYYDHWEKTLLHAVWDIPDYQTLINASEDLFENPMLITNWQGKLLGYTKSYKNVPIRSFWTELTESGILPIYCLQNLRESSHFDILKEENKAHLLYFEKFNYTCILGLVHEKHEVILHFQIIEYNRKLTETDLLLAETFLSVLKRAHREIKPAYHESSTYIFSQLLSGEPVDSKLLNWVLSAMGWASLNSRFYLICFQVMDQKGNAESMLMQLERSILGSKVLIHEEMPIMLLSESLLENFQEDIIYINRKWHLKCGISMPFSDWQHLNIYFQQASTVIAISENNAMLHFCRDHASFFLTKEIRQSISSQKMLHPDIQILQDYDLANHTELLNTLHCYLLNERNSTLTAGQLHIHRNTLQYRLRKIRDLIKTNLDDPYERLHLLLSCE